MNTEQNYVGRASHANTVEQTDKTTQQTPEPQDWRDAFLHSVIANDSAKEYLFDLLELVRDQVEGLEAIPLIDKMFKVWVKDQSVRIAEERHALRDIVGHIVFLNELNTLYTLFNAQTNYVDSVPEEVRHA